MMKHFFWILLPMAMFAACAKEAGQGGNSKIQGKLYARNICSDNGDTVALYPLAGERVYISYGNTGQFDDDVRTGADGQYEFDFLTKGDYAIYAIGECLQCAESQIISKVEVEITDAKQTAQADSLMTSRVNNEWCQGPGRGGIAKATGLLQANYINRFTLDTIGLRPVADTRVYLVYGSGNTHADDVRSSADGSFLFDELRPGNYRVYAYSDCEFCTQGLAPVFVDFNIAEGQREVAIPAVTILLLD